MDNNTNDKGGSKKTVGMKNKIVIAAGVLFVLSAIYLVTARGQMKKASLTIDSNLSKTEEAYKTRLKLMGDFVEKAEPIMSAEKKSFDNFEKAQKQYKNEKSIEEKVKTINRMEGELQEMLAAAPDYQNFQNDAAAASLLGQMKSDQSFTAGKKGFNDAIAKYNFTIHRIRYRAASAFFGIESRSSLRPLSDLEKAALSKREKAKEKSSVVESSGN